MPYEFLMYAWPMPYLSSLLTDYLAASDSLSVLVLFCQLYFITLKEAFGSQEEYFTDLGASIGGVISIEVTDMSVTLTCHYT